MTGVLDSLLVAVVLTEGRGVAAEERWMGGMARLHSYNPLWKRAPDGDGQPVI